MIKFMKSKAQDINKHHRKVFFFFGCRKLYLNIYIYIYIEIKDRIKKKFKSTYLLFFFEVTILWFNGI